MCCMFIGMFWFAAIKALYRAMFFMFPPVMFSFASWVKSILSVGVFLGYMFFQISCRLFSSGKGKFMINFRRRVKAVSRVSFMLVASMANPR